MIIVLLVKWMPFFPCKKNCIAISDISGPIRLHERNVNCTQFGKLLIDIFYNYSQSSIVLPFPHVVHTNEE